MSNIRNCAETELNLLNERLLFGSLGQRRNLEMTRFMVIGQSRWRPWNNSVRCCAQHMKWSNQFVLHWKHQYTATFVYLHRNILRNFVRLTVYISGFPLCAGIAVFFKCFSLFSIALIFSFQPREEHAQMMVTRPR